jgi:preprotein translocase subunit SecF
MRFFHNTNIDFIGKRKTFFFVSLITITLTLIGSIIIGPVMGIDFAGGTEIGVKFQNTISAEEVRTAIESSGFDGAEIKSFGTANSYLIRVKDSDDAPTLVENALNSKIANNPHTTLKVDKIGPKIGSEMRNDGLIAIVLAVIIILLYIGFRFEFVYGIGAIVALVHDVLLTFTFIVVFNKLGIVNLEINQSTLAALLTVLGYSINDTVIIFDRIRENVDKIKGRKLTEIFNLSINETLSRTINTTLTTSIVLLIIVIFGGPVLQGFAFTMLVGFIVGTYSSVFIASSFVLWYSKKSKAELV